MTCNHTHTHVIYWIIYSIFRTLWADGDLRFFLDTTLIVILTFGEHDN